VTTLDPVHLPLLSPISPPPPDLALGVGGAVIVPQAGRPWLASFGEIPEPMTATLVSYPDRTPIADLAQVAHEWEDPANAYGSAVVTIDGADPAVALLDEGQLIEHRLYGQLAFVSVVEQWEIRQIEQGEEVDELCVISGRSHLSLLELAVVYPLLFGTGPGGSVTIDRAFNWASADFDDSSWVAATELERQGDGVGPQPTFCGSFGANPRGWPDPDSYWIWSQPYEGNVPGCQVYMPTGTSYFRHDFTVAEPVVARIYVGADNAFEAWLDGMLVYRSEPQPYEAWPTPRHFDVALAAGNHTIGIAGTNYVVDFVVGNLAGIIAAAFEIDPTSNEPDLGELIFRTDDSWLALNYPPSPPGFTPGAVIRLVVEEAQARGGLVPVTFSFDDSVDSAGQPWPIVTNIATRIGTDVGTFVVSELGETYVDVRMEPGGYVLDAWVKGTQGETTSVQLDAAPANDPREGALTTLRRVFG